MCSDQTAQRFVAIVLALLTCVLAANHVAADTITLNADRDNNLLEAATLGVSGRQLNDVNIGAQPRLLVGRTATPTNNDNRSIISFDTSPLAGQYGSIDSITMRLTFEQVTTLDYSKSFDIDVYKISSANADWVEGTGSNTGAASDDVGVTWNQKNRNVANWAGGDGTPANGGLRTPGVDYENTLLASISTGTALPAPNTVFDFEFTGTSAELTSLMDSLIADQSGFLLFTETPDLVVNQDRLFFYSRETATEEFRPQLIVEFSTAAVPEPGSIAIWSLLGLAGMVFGWRQWRKSHSAQNRQ